MSNVNAQAVVNDKPVIYTMQIGDQMSRSPWSSELNKFESFAAKGPLDLSQLLGPFCVFCGSVFANANLFVSHEAETCVSIF